MVLVQNKYKNNLVGVLRTQITFVTHSSPSCYVTLRTQVIRLNSGNLSPQKTDSGVFIIIFTTIKRIQLLYKLLNVWYHGRFVFNSCILFSGILNPVRDLNKTCGWLISELKDKSTIFHLTVKMTVWLIWTCIGNFLKWHIQQKLQYIVDFNFGIWFYKNPYTKETNVYEGNSDLTTPTLVKYIWLLLYDTSKGTYPCVHNVKSTILTGRWL